MIKTNSLSLIAAAITLALSASAQAEQQPNNNKEKVETIIVSGTPGGAGIRKIDASFAVTNIDAVQIDKLAPKSTADLLKAVPGIWVESSGGESGANVFVRGFPGGGDAPFLTVSLQGSPIYPAPTLSFLENTSIFRLDETISMMEGLRGGPNPVVSNGQPGLTTNFQLKRGQADTEGTFKYTTTDYGLNRIDGVLSGEISNDLYYMVGGYIKRSSGIRDAGFTSEKGHQFTINLTKEFADGEFNLYTRQTDDTGAWYLPTPLNVEGVDADFTQLGTNNRKAIIYVGDKNAPMSVDMGDGRGWKGHVSGGSLKVEFKNGWQLNDRFSLTQGDANTLGLVPAGSAMRLSEVADNGETATGSVTGDEYAGDTMVQQYGRWVVLKDIEAFTNDLALSKTFGDWSSAFGIYTATTSAKDWWSLGNTAYHVLEQGGEALNGIACNSDVAGCAFNYDINSSGDATTWAIYTTQSYQATEALKLDLGLRSEQHEVEYSVDEGLDGVITKAVDYDERKTSWTLGADYSLSLDSGVFVRMNKGYKMPYFDDFRDNYSTYESGESLIKEVTQAELGYKYMGETGDLFVTLFTNEVKGDTFVRRPGVPAEILTNEATGVELDYSYNHESGLSVNLNATWQDTEITESPTNEGNKAQRQPDWMLRITPSYDFEISGMYATLYGTLSAVDDRFGDNENTVVLEGYEKLDIGLIVEPTEGVKLQLAVDNLTDKQGITEGDPRNPDSPNGRYIMPRSVKFSVAYTF
ncbi:TonB-dependent receptor [Pseudoalteromonas piscicida]|uniref:TonB-dependent receptor n=1 Tax=Pseudoalteromonas piscicida TaxID=43662 RepID=A0AAQ2EWV6_PSEO7|nr:MULTISPECIES: TonB-dependent receptor [Pseudoalteromonas]KJY89747.1 TonB-dependent receptor [Pseudoalteromonas piscicida]TMN36511.1 TonB-dependent receptor [Pseudoalteromonas piscicida]TMN40097.1 TonB-dependent receptor [Pseudoalteromonas piscicida]TMN54098.1 TonB-dependent receptor [Pseudoalteromonas piscicida]TMN55882.1 TonB-dependent receptor [Pseudoalteromonas piscicida]